MSITKSLLKLAIHGAAIVVAFIVVMFAFFMGVPFLHWIGTLTPSILASPAIVLAAVLYLSVMFASLLVINLASAWCIRRLEQAH